MRPSRRTQPYRKSGARPASPTLSAMKRGRTLFGANPQDLHRLAVSKAARRRRRRLGR